MLVTIGFSIFSLVTGHQVTTSESALLDTLFTMFLGAGAFGVVNAGHKRYTEYKNGTK